MTRTMNSSESATGADAGYIELLQMPPLGMDVDSLLQDFTHYFGRTLGRRTIRKRLPFIYQALALAVRDRLMERWNRTNIAAERSDSRRVCYLSLEFLMGRLTRNALLSLGIEGKPSRSQGSGSSTWWPFSMR